MGFSGFGLTDAQAWAIIGALVFMGLDILSGFIAACANHEVNSTKMREGLWHKASMILLIFCCWFGELLIGHVPDLGVSIPATGAVCAVIIAMEVISIVENVLKAYPELAESPLIHMFDAGKEGE